MNCSVELCIHVLLCIIEFLSQVFHKYTMSVTSFEIILFYSPSLYPLNHLQFPLKIPATSRFCFSLFLISSQVLLGSSHVFSGDFSIIKVAKKTLITNAKTRVTLLKCPVSLIEYSHIKR